MLQSFSSHISECLQHAAEMELAAARCDPLLRSEYEAIAQKWRLLADGFEFVESLEGFLLDAECARKALPD